jgi:hypothetical protein
MNDGRALSPYDKREAIPLTAAAKMADVTPETVRLWCLQYRIGRKIVSRWKVSKPALLMLLDGERATLRAYLLGDRGEDVRQYFERAGVPLQSGGRAHV